MTAANKQDPKKTGAGDGGITQQLEALGIKDQAGAGHNSATGGEAGEVARCVKDFCNRAVTNLKAGRLEEAHYNASEALELDGKDVKATALHRYTLYALHPEKRLLEKATALRDEAAQWMEAGDYDKAHELLTLATKWRCTPSMLFLRSVVNSKRGCFALAYFDVTEALAAGMKGDVAVDLQKSCLRSPGLKVPQVVEPQQQRRMDEGPAHSPRINLPNGVRVENLLVRLQRGYAEVMNNFADFAPLRPPIPIDQLARFLNERAQGTMENLMFIGGEGREDAMLRLLDEVTVPGRLHAANLFLGDFFHLNWAGVKRILDGRTLRAKEIQFLRLQLSSGVDPNELFKLPTIRDCTLLSLHLYNLDRPQLPSPPPLFKTAALLEWLKQSDGQTLLLTREYLSSGLLGFLDALKKDFRQATQAHSYRVAIRCPDFDVANGLGVRDEQLFNRLGERMAISVGEDPAAAETMGHRFETVALERFPPNAKTYQ